jgi:predicted metal-dependent HD superfamily phosphohydrolase
MTLLAHWESAWRELGVSNADNSLFHQLVACYSEPHRKYHTMQHLNECFAHLETLRLAAERPAEVELAVWFHDAIYETRRKNNEEKSAEWARDSALAGGLPRDSAARIYDLVMVTKHNVVLFGRDAAIMVDIDLGILGTEAARFDEYENQVREEYSWVPWPLYRRERRKILHGFLSRQTIYCTEHFRTSYEAQARDNIARSLARL